MRIFLDQLGCRLNYSENETLAGRLQNAGHTLVATPEQAQVVVLNTCAVTSEASSKSRQTVRQLHKANPAARIVVTGCYATLEPAKAAALPGVALVANNQEKELLHTLLEPWSAELDDLDALSRLQPDGSPIAPAPSPFQNGSIQLEAPRSRTRAFIKVQDGCNNKCTFCIVTVARGESRSRRIADIVAEVQALAADGVQEAVLTGVHLGGYGRDLAGEKSSNLKELTTALLRETDIVRLRLSSLEPWELADGFFDLWGQWPDRLCPHLHLPLQAGTDRQLRRMARRCTTESFRHLVEEARAAIPDLILTTDLIVGFPGEREADFAQGLAYVAEMGFAHAHIFPFSARSGTAAARFGSQVVREVKKERSRRMHQVVEESGRKERRRFVGQTRPVLWEGEGAPVTDGPGKVWSGFTDNYLRVMAVASDGENLHNQITPTQLTDLHGDTLFGTIPGI